MRGPVDIYTCGCSAELMFCFLVPISHFLIQWRIRRVGLAPNPRGKSPAVNQHTCLPYPDDCGLQRGFPPPLPSLAFRGCMWQRGCPGRTLALVWSAAVATTSASQPVAASSCAFASCSFQPSAVVEVVHQLRLLHLPPLSPQLPPLAPPLPAPLLQPALLPFPPPLLPLPSHPSLLPPLPPPPPPSSSLPLLLSPLLLLRLPLPMSFMAISKFVFI